MNVKNRNSFRLKSSNKKIITPISSKITPVKIINNRKKENDKIIKYRTCQNFNKMRNTFDYSINKDLNINNRRKSNVNSSIYSHTLKANKTMSIKNNRIINQNSLTKVNNKISLLSPVKRNIHLNEENIKKIKNEYAKNYNSNKNINEKKNKNLPKILINKFFIPNYVKNILNSLTNQTNKATNYTSFTTNDKNNLNKNEIEYEKQSEFLNLELAQFKHLSDESFESINSEKNYEEKEMNPEELCIYFQNKKNINILNPNQNNKLFIDQSFYCIDTNEMNEGEDIQKVYSMTTHFNTNWNNWNKYRKILNNKKVDNINMLSDNISSLVLNYNNLYKGNGNSFRKNIIKKE